MLIPARSGDGAVARVRTAPVTRSLSAHRWALTAVIVVAAVARFAVLGAQSYWFDEAQAAHEFHLSFGSMLSSWSANEPNPPLYFALGWLWAQLFGTGEVGLRALSALAGTGFVAVVYLCGAELVSRRAGLVVAALAAINPFLIWYSAEAREYMLLGLLAAASLLFFARAWRDLSRRHLAWWAAFSGLALLTQYFAIFLVGGEALGLGWRWLRGRERVRTRRDLVGALAIVGVAGAAVLPHALGHLSHPAGWIDSFPLSIRIEQVPVAFGLSTLYQSSLVSAGLWSAAVLAGCLIVLLVAGAEAAALRGAAIAGALAACVLLVPLALALAGHDYYEARALLPAWAPLAIVTGAACTARRARLGGAALGLVLAGLFVYGDLRIAGDAKFQKADWKGVAAALGPTVRDRAVVADDGTFATAPLALYVPGVAWTSAGQIPQSTRAPVRVAEVDVVGNVYQHVAAVLPAGVTPLGAATVEGYRVMRFAVPGGWALTPREIARRAARLLGPAPPGAGVLIARVPRSDPS